jgi:hypothetical protein
MSRLHGLTAVLLGILLTASLFVWSPPVEAASGTVITDETTWSGYNEVVGDITVMSGGKLILEPGTILNMTTDSTIIVEGALDIKGTPVNPSIIFGSHIAPTSNSPRWEGIQVTQAGTMSVQNLNLADARGGFHVLGTLDLQGNVIVHNTTVGYFIEGVMTVNGGSPICDLVGNVCMIVEGTISIPTLEVTNSSAALRVRNGGTATVTSISATTVGIGLEVLDGTTVDIDTLKLDRVNVGLLTSDSVAVDIEKIIVQGDVGVCLDLTDSAGIDVASIESTAGILTRVIRGSGVAQLDVGEISATGATDGAWGIELDIVGNTSIGGGSLSGYSYGVSIRGSGSADLGELNISADEMSVSASGSGDLTAMSGNWSNAATIASISSATSNLSMMTLSGSSTTEIGVEYITGSHTMTAAVISRPYLSQDRNSIGIKSLWSEVTSDATTLTGWHRGVSVQQDATFTSSSLSSTVGGRDEGASISVEGGEFFVDTLDTSSAEHGLDLLAGTAHVGTWTAANHREETLALSDSTSATIRTLPAFATVGQYDAFGDGTLLWGGSTSNRVVVTAADYLTESTVTVTDLSAAAVPDVEVSAHGFDSITDASGEVTLPLLANGSEVSAIASDGTGTTITLSSPSGTIQLPLLPESGDWVISSGINAELHNGMFSLPENLTIESSASLKLVDATISLPDNGTFTAEGTGELIGDGGSISGGWGNHTSASHPYAGMGSGLDISQPINIDCSSSMTMTGVSFEDDIILGAGCQISVHGSVSDDAIVTLGSAAEVEVISGLQLRVLDKGIPVVGAAVHIDGQDLFTDSTGTITTSSRAKLIDSSGTTITGTLAVNIVHSGVSEWKAWDTSQTVSMDVMVSTLSGGLIGSWTRIDSQFSPYHLADDLTVPVGKTLQLLQGSSIALSNASSIIVQGTFEMDDATLSGSDWQALQVSGQASIDGGQISGGSIVAELGGDVELADVLVTGSEVSVSGSGSTLSMTDGVVMQTERCLRADGSGAVLTASGTTLDSCGQYALWATDAKIELENIILAAGSGTGLWLQRASGNVTNLNATAHDGSGPVYRLDAIESLAVSGGTIQSGGTSAAIVVDHSENIDIRGISILGTPSFIIEESAGSIADMTVDGMGSVGSGIEIIGSTADLLALHQINVSGHDIALNLRGSIDDAENQPIQTTDCTFDGATSIDADSLPFLSSGDSLLGSVILDSTSKRFVGTIIDAEPNSVTVSGSAVLQFGRIHTLLIVDDLAAPITNSSADITVPSFAAEIDSQSIEGVSSESTFVLIYRVLTMDEDRTSSSGYYSASADSHLPAEGGFALGSGIDTIVRVVLQANDPPQAMILEPSDAVEQPEGANISVRAAGTDPDTGHAEALTFEWYLTGVGESSFDVPILTGYEGQVFIEQGEWTLWLVTTDPVGATATDSVSIIISAPDNDGDFINSCPVDGESPWYDLSELRYCGPDQWDLDDDNDGWKDDRDAFPMDECASKDSDDDGQPDDIEEGCTTSLSVDDDDDNDGILDVYDPTPTTPGTGVTEEVESSFLVKLFSPGVILPLLAAIGVFIFLIRQRMENDGSERKEE